MPRITPMRFTKAEQCLVFWAGWASMARESLVWPPDVARAAARRRAEVAREWWEQYLVERRREGR